MMEEEFFTHWPKPSNPVSYGSASSALNFDGNWIYACNGENVLNRIKPLSLFVKSSSKFGWRPPTLCKSRGGFIRATGMVPSFGRRNLSVSNMLSHAKEAGMLLFVQDRKLKWTTTRKKKLRLLREFDVPILALKTSNSSPVLYAASSEYDVFIGKFHENIVHDHIAHVHIPEGTRNVDFHRNWPEKEMALVSATGRVCTMDLNTQRITELCQGSTDFEHTWYGIAWGSHPRTLCVAGSMFIDQGDSTGANYGLFTVDLRTKSPVCWGKQEVKDIIALSLHPMRPFEVVTRTNRRINLYDLRFPQQSMLHWATIPVIQDEFSIRGTFMLNSDIDAKRYIIDWSSTPLNRINVYAYAGDVVRTSQSWPHALESYKSFYQQFNSISSMFHFMDTAHPPRCSTIPPLRGCAASLEGECLKVWQLAADGNIYQQDYTTNATTTTVSTATAAAAAAAERIPSSRGTFGNLVSPKRTELQDLGNYEDSLNVKIKKYFNNLQNMTIEHQEPENDIFFNELPGSPLLEGDPRSMPEVVWELAHLWDLNDSNNTSQPEPTPFTRPDQSSYMDMPEVMDYGEMALMEAMNSMINKDSQSSITKKKRRKGF